MGELLFARHKFSRAAFTLDLVLPPIVLYLVYFAAFSSLTPASRGKQPSEESQSERGLTEQASVTERLCETAAASPEFAPAPGLASQGRK